MDTDSKLKLFKYSAKRHLRSLIIWFICSFSLSTLCYLLAKWVEYQAAWEAKVIWNILYIIGGILGLMSLMFAALIFSWFRKYNEAKNLAIRDDDWDKVKYIYRDVLGPVPWK